MEDKCTEDDWEEISASSDAEGAFQNEILSAFEESDGTTSCSQNKRGDYIIPKIRNQVDEAKRTIEITLKTSRVNKRKGITKVERLEREFLHKMHIMTILLAANLRVRWIDKLSKWINKISNFVPNVYEEEAVKLVGKIEGDKTAQLVNFLRKITKWWKEEIHTKLRVGSTKNALGPGSVAKEFVMYLRWKEYTSKANRVSPVQYENEEDFESETTRKKALDCENVSTECSSLIYASLLKHYGFRTRVVIALYPVPLSLSKTAIAVNSDSRNITAPSRKRANDEYRNTSGSSSVSSSKRRRMKKLNEDVQKYIINRERSAEFGKRKSRDISLDDISEVQKSADRKILESFEMNFPVHPYYLWLEIYNGNDSWIPVDAVRGCVKDHILFEPNDTTKKQLQFSYIVVNEPPHPYMDITSNYTTKWGSITSKVRLKVEKDDRDWWCETLKVFNEYINSIPEHPLRNVSPVDRNKIFEAQLREKMPTTLSGFHNHPLYALESQLKKNEIIYPTGRENSIGFFRNSYVYPRTSVYTLKNRLTWLKEGKLVRDDSKPIKIVPAKNISSSRKKKIEMEKYCLGISNSEVNTLFASFQTEDYVATPLINDIVPRNAFGNFELFHERMLPSNAKHIVHPGVDKLAEKYKISYAPAVVGFEYSRNAITPIIKGIIVPIKHFDTLETQCRVLAQESSELAEKKRRERIRGLWKKAISFALNKVRVYRKFGQQQGSLDSKRTLQTMRDIDSGISLRTSNDQSPPSSSNEDEQALSSVWDSL